MCVSVSPGVPVHFSNTVLYAAEALREDGTTVHVLGYQNRVGEPPEPPGVLSKVKGFFFPKGSGNAMLLPFPAQPKTMTQSNVVDTSACRDVLQDMAIAVAPPSFAAPVAAGIPRASSAPPRVQVFEAAGIYTVVLAQDARDIPDALARVPAAKRPALNPVLFDAYARWYPGWTFALCCFDRHEAGLAHPLVWWYAPMHPDRLFLPAVDCHTGAVPDLEAQVSVDHTIAVGSHRMTGGFPVSYRDAIPEAAARYILPLVIGGTRSEKMPNGDFVCRVEDVVRGTFAPAREMPPAARASRPLRARS